MDSTPPDSQPSPRPDQNGVGPLPIGRDEPLRGIGRIALNKWHEDHAADPILFADEEGAFPPARVPLIFPIVVDANVVRSELLRMARTGNRTVLASAAGYGVLRLFCARHVIEEVLRHMDEWSAQGDVDPELVRAVWRDSYMRLLRWVDIPSTLLYTSEELGRLRVLADPDKGDRDDLPTAILTLLLDAPLLSRDRKPLVAVYGEGIDHIEHREWLENLRAGGDLGPLGQAIQATAIVGGGITMAGYEGLRALAKHVPWPILLGMVAAGAYCYSRFASPETKQKVVDGVKMTSKFAFEALGELSVTYIQAESTFEQLPTPSSSPHRIHGDALTPEAMLTRSCIYHLARYSQSNMSAAELSSTLRNRLSLPCGEQKVRATLREHACFVEVYRGRFQVGRSLVRRAVANSNDDAPGGKVDEPS